MATESIPKEWRETVCTILRLQDNSKIQITLRAQKDFAAQFPNAWNFNLYNFLTCYLSRSDATGQLVADLKPPGAAYEFICKYEGEPVYAKINLLVAGDVIIIVSAHRPLKGNKL